VKKPPAALCIAAVVLIAGIALAIILRPAGNMRTKGQSNRQQAPLYWSVYEYHFTREKAGVKDNYISEEEFLANIEWVEKNLKPYGFDMIATDGWGDMGSWNEYGYRTKHSSHWEHDYAWWSAELQKRGMKLGVYDNPLWINRVAAERGVMVRGTKIPLKSLIDYSETSAFGFTWVQVERPGAKEYIDGCIRYYAEIGVKYLRVDFLSWYETGTDDNMGIVGKIDRPRADYETALKWMREACDRQGVFLSLVMPHLKNDAELEAQYGHMIRINEDTAEGAWYRFSDNARGRQKSNWSQFRNPFDGFIYWSRITGKGRVILDGDFIRLNTYANDDERRAVVSLHVIAGGPVTVADQYNTIGENLWIYQNDELLSLTREGFSGKPLSGDPRNNEKNQIWKGQAANGDWIVAFFNRERTGQAREIDFAAELDMAEGLVRDIWAHEDMGIQSRLSGTIPPHGCKIYRISTVR
jgi:hypothetical protein